MKVDDKQNISRMGYVSNIFKSILTIIESYIIGSKLGIYLLWMFLHYISSHLYVKWCTPIGISGFIYSLFMGPTPLCYALSWTIFTGNQSLLHMWSIIGAIFIGRLEFKKDKNE